MTQQVLLGFNLGILFSEPYNVYGQLLKRKQWKQKTLHYDLEDMINDIRSQNTTWSQCERFISFISVLEAIFTVIKIITDVYRSRTQ